MVKMILLNTTANMLFGASGGMTRRKCVRNFQVLSPTEQQRTTTYAKPLDVVCHAKADRVIT